MALSVLVGPLAWAVGDGTANSNTASETSLLLGTAASGKWAMPGGFFIAPGQTIRITATLRLTTTTGTNNSTFKVKIGSVAVATSPTFVNQASQTNLTMRLTWLLTLRAVGDGTSANFMHVGTYTGAAVSATNQINPIPATAPAVGTGFDSSTAATLDLTHTWSAASASNSMTLHQYVLESVV
jgi:hypothetical protein